MCVAEELSASGRVGWGGVVDQLLAARDAGGGGEAGQRRGGGAAGGWWLYVRCQNGRLEWGGGGGA
jgi:hypothetical protein